MKTLPEFGIDKRASDGRASACRKCAGIASNACRVRKEGRKPRVYLTPLDKEELRILYIDKKMTTRAIAKQVGVSCDTLTRWMDDFGIERRPANNGLEYRGVAAPSREELYRMIYEDCLSYQAIAEKYSVDQSAIPHWLKKHNIKMPPSIGKRKLPPIDELIKLYEDGLSTIQLQHKYGVSSTSIAKYLRNNGVQIRLDGWNGGIRFSCDDGHLVRSTYELRVDNWLNAHNLPHIYEPPIPEHEAYHADFSVNGWFIEVWGVQGNAAYKERKIRKLNLYKTLGLPLIQLHNWDFASRPPGLWERKLSTCLQLPNGV